MSQVRKDKKGRILRRGERQESDGRFSYRYMDEIGHRHTVYSWKLVVTDKLPPGVRSGDLSLREKEDQIRKDIDAGLRNHDADKTTANTLLEQFLADRKDLDEVTLSGYKALYDKHFRDTLGGRKIKNVLHSDIRRLYSDMIYKKGLKMSTVASLNSCIGQIFQIAVNDKLLSSNPAVGATLNLLSRDEKSMKGKREGIALTEVQCQRLLAFTDESPRFHRMLPLLTVLFGTGLRISEAVGLTEDKLDFEEGVIAVTQELRYRPGLDGHYHYIFHPYVKTYDGVREVPMLDNVRDALCEQVEILHASCNPVFEIDGVSGFLFLNKAGKPFTPTHVYEIIQSIVKAYNEQEQKRGKKAVFIPKIGPHNARHTFCSRLNDNEVNVKTIQAVMGHKNPSTSLRTYTHKDNSQIRAEINDALNRSAKSTHKKKPRTKIYAKI